MRYPKFLINAFATLGVFAFIFLACSVAENVDDTVVIDDEIVIVDDENPPIENNYGKYQITIDDASNSNPSTYNTTTILNTETGEVRIYYYSTDNAYTLVNTQNLGGF